MVLNNCNTIQWLRKRHSTRAKAEYLNSPDEIGRYRDMLNVFRKFDADQSGTLEFNELSVLFAKSGLKLPKQELLMFFRMFDQDHSGAISVKEFIDILINDEANRLFRAKAERARSSTPDAPYVPRSIPSFFNFLNSTIKRNELLSNIKVSYRWWSRKIKWIIKNSEKRSWDYLSWKAKLQAR